MVAKLSPQDGDLRASSEQTTTNVLPPSLIASTHNSATCRRCGKPLRSKLAIEVGYGAVCVMRELGGDHHV